MGKLKKLKRIGQLKALKNTKFIACSAQARDLLGFKIEKEGFDDYGKSFSSNS
jgi:invasion protein IalB